MCAHHDNYTHDLILTANEDAGGDYGQPLIQNPSKRRQAMESMLRDLIASNSRDQDKKKKKTKDLESPQPKVKRISEIAMDLGDMR